MMWFCKECPHCKSKPVDYRMELKRLYFKKKREWPTDKQLKEYLDAGGHLL